MNNSSANRGAPGEDWLAVVWSQIQSLEFGAVEIVVRDAKPVQFDRKERWRLAGPSSENNPAASQAAPGEIP